MNFTPFRAKRLLPCVLAATLAPLLAHAQVQAQPEFQYRIFRAGLKVPEPTGAPQELQLSVSSLDLGTPSVGAPASSSVQLLNPGGAAHVISAVQVSGSLDYSVDTDCGSSLAAGRSCTAIVTFLPSTYGVQTGLLTFNTPLGDHKVSLTGNGQAATAALSASTLTLSATHQGSPAPSQSLTLTNGGNIALVVQSVSLSGANAADFFVSGCSAPVAPGDSCALSVGYTPSSTGDGSATLTVVSNALGAPSQTVSLVGKNSNSEDPYWGKTVLAINAEGGLTDVTGKNTLSLAGNPTVSTAQKKFGNGSLYLGASIDRITVPNTLLQLGDRDFTIETWAFIPALKSGNQYLLVQEELSISNNSHLGLGLLVSPSGALVALWNVGTAQNNLGASIAVQVNTWNHLAITRKGGTVTLWVNGVAAGSKSIGSVAINPLSASAVTRIGKYSLEGDTSKYVGYMDDFRVTMDVARYNSNFAVPPAPMPTH